MRWLPIGLIIANIALALAAVYGVFGAVWIWQVGANPATWSPLFGSQSYLASLQTGGFDCAITYGILNYRIKYFTSTGEVLGPAILDWTQFFVLVIAIVDVGTLVYFLRPRIKK